MASGAWRRLGRLCIGFAFSAGLSALALGASLLGSGSPAQAVGVFPGGFSSQVMANVDGMVAFDSASDGRVFIATKKGQVRVLHKGVLLPTPFVDMSAEVNHAVDRGLLGIAVHPNFPATPYIYVLYTYDPPGATADADQARVSRLVRITANPNNTNIAASRMVLLGTNSTLANSGAYTVSNGSETKPACGLRGSYVRDCIASDARSHSIGGLDFAPDGSLYISVGDAARYENVDSRALRAIDIDSLNGKILRINPLTGLGYADNPYATADLGANRSKVFDLGLRNPYRFTLDSQTGQLWIGDVGWGTYEEINTGRGKNFGWPCYEGAGAQLRYSNESATSAACSQYPASAVTAPVYAHPHGKGAAVTGGPIYRGTKYPSMYQGKLFWAEFVGKTMNVFDPATKTNQLFATSIGTQSYHGPVAVNIGPDGDVWYIVLDQGGSGASTLNAIRYNRAGNHPPVAHIVSSTNSGLLPLTATFNASTSTDPDKDTLTYVWNFGDGSTATGVSATHVYHTAGTYTARLTATDPAGADSVDEITMYAGNTPPTIAIDTPAKGANYAEGSTVKFAGTATDREQGNLSSSIHWTVLLHHNEHVHSDILDHVGKQGSFAIPEHPDSSWAQLCASITDRFNAKAQTCVDLSPAKVDVSITTEPAGITTQYDETQLSTPLTAQSIVNSVRSLSMPATVVKDGITYRFVSWSDGGARVHNITVGTSAMAYRAIYEPVPATCPTAIKGWKTEYFTDLTKPAVLCADQASLDANWKLGSFTPHTRTDGFGVRWSRSMYNSNPTKFRMVVNADDAVKMWIDDKLVIDSWHTQSYREYYFDITLSAGWHKYVVQYYDVSGEARASFTWANHGTLMGACDGRPGVYLYSGVNYTGTCLRVTGNATYLPHVLPTNVSSIKIVGGPWKVTLYQYSGYKGKSVVITGYRYTLEGTAVGNKKTSSLTVSPG